MIFNISSSGELQIGDLILLLTAIGTIFSSLLIVPKIIANYLFPLNEENNMNDLIKIMQENDSKIRSKIDL